MDKEFEEKCLSKYNKEVGPEVTKILKEEEMLRISEHHKKSADYFLEGAKTLLSSNTPLLSILLGFFAIEHKANQLLSKKGYKVESHRCTSIGLSRVIGRKDLAKTITKIFNLRQGIGYRMFLSEEVSERKNAEEIINNDIIPFFNEIDKLKENEK